MRAAVVAAVLALGTLIPASAVVASPLSFTEPTFIDHQPPYGASGPVSRRQP